MLARNKLQQEIELLPDDCLEEVMDFVAFLKHRRLKQATETMLASEDALAKDWDTPEEDAAWASL